MFRYIALVWNDAHQGHCAAAQLIIRQLQTSSRRWTAALALPGLQVFHCGGRTGSTEAHPLPRSAGVILGTLFQPCADTQAPRRKTTFSAADTARVLETGGRSLIADYWGRYVAFAHDSARRRTFLLRDPTGALPCFHAAFRDVHLFFSSAEDCASLGLLDLPVDWEFIAERAAFPLRASQTAARPSIRRTAIKQISIVQPGEQVEVHRGALTRSLAWDPLQIAQAAPIQDGRQGAEQLRHAAKACVHAWAACYHGVLHSLSGGLDSSIVLGCLSDAQHRPYVTCLNYHSFSSGGDERYFARLAANQAHCPLIEWERDCAIPLEDLRCMERSAAPVNYLNWLQVSRREARLAREIGADAVFSGDGGDELFCRNQGILGAADYLRSKGVNRHFIEVALDTAHVENCSLWHVIREAFKQRRAPDGAPAGKCRHAASLCAPYEHADPLSSLDSPERVQPLLSQPLIELCLRIPTYLLTSKGWDRAMARQAFSEDVPREILRRRSKASMNENVLDVLKRNTEAARELLLDGELVGNGVIERAALETALSDGASDKTSAHEVFELLSTEAWLRSWKSPRGVHVAH